MKDTPPYTSIKHGKSKDFLGLYNALWRGSDHLLLVQNRIFTQSYKRFYFSDIQGLVAQVTDRRATVATTFGLLCIPSILFAFLVNGLLFRYFWLGVSLLFAAAFAINWYRGPTCKAMIITNVQSHLLPIKRLKKARKIFEELRFHIHQRQGNLKPAETTKPLIISQKKDQHVKSVKSRNNQPVSVDDYSYSGGYHLAFFFTLFAIGVLNGLQLYSQHVVIVLGEMILAIILLLLMVLALKNQHTSAMEGLLKNTTWAALALIFVAIGLSYVDLMISLTGGADEEIFADQVKMVIFMATRNPENYPYWKFLLYFHLVSFPLVSIPGLVQTLSFQKNRSEVS